MTLLDRFNEISRFSLTPDQLQALNIAMLAEITKVLQGRRYITKNFQLMETLAIRDTNDHNSDHQVDLYQADQYSFYINNGCNEVLTFRILGLLTQNAGAAPIGDPLTVPARGVDCVSVNVKELWQPWIGCRATFGTAPTSGSVNVIMCRREENWGQSA